MGEPASYEDLFRSAASEDGLPEQLQQQLLSWGRSHDRGVLIRLAGNEVCTPAVFAELCEETDPRVRAACLSSPNATADQLAAMIPTSNVAAVTRALSKLASNRLSFNDLNQRLALFVEHAKLANLVDIVSESSFSDKARLAAAKACTTSKGALSADRLDKLSSTVKRVSERELTEALADVVTHPHLVLSLIRNGPVGVLGDRTTGFWESYLENRDALNTLHSCSSWLPHLHDPVAGAEQVEARHLELGGDRGSEMIEGLFVSARAYVAARDGDEFVMFDAFCAAHQHPYCSSEQLDRMYETAQRSKTLTWRLVLRLHEKGLMKYRSVVWYDEDPKDPCDAARLAAASSNLRPLATCDDPEAALRVFVDERSARPGSDRSAEIARAFGEVMEVDRNAALAAAVDCTPEVLRHYSARSVATGVVMWLLESASTPQRLELLGKYSDGFAGTAAELRSCVDVGFDHPSA